MTQTSFPINGSGIENVDLPTLAEVQKEEASDKHKETPGFDIAGKSKEEAAVDLRGNACAVRISFTKMGVTKKLTGEQKEQAADVFDADAQSLSASKRIVDTKHPIWKKLSKKFSEIRAYWESVTLPYPEDAVRLGKRDRIPEIDARFRELQTELKQLAGELANVFSEFIEHAREKLGSLFNASDYPSPGSVASLFNFSWDFPSLEPPEWMKQNPWLYEQESAKVQALFHEAVRIKEQEMLQQFADMVEGLKERMTDGEGGEKKKFKKSTIEGFDSFFSEVDKLVTKDNTKFKELIEQARGIVSGVKADEIRKAPDDVREQIRAGMDAIGKSLKESIGVAPKRKIIVKKKEEAVSSSNPAQSDGVVSPLSPVTEGNTSAA